MNRFVVAEPLWCTGCNTCLAACSDVHKNARFTATPAPGPGEDVNTHCPCRVSSL